MKASRSHVTGFVTKETTGVLQLDTGSTLYKLDAKAVILKNPRLQKMIGGTRQVTVMIDGKDILAIKVGARGQSLRGR